MSFTLTTLKSTIQDYSENTETTQEVVEESIDNEDVVSSSEEEE